MSKHTASKGLIVFESVQWRYIDEHYLITEFGKVYSLYRNRFLKNFTSTRGFIQVNIHSRNQFVHKLMAEAFSGGKVSWVRFKNGDRKDLRLSNLEWR
jgi:hypothetical protein